MSNSPHVVISGYYGFGNAGDEAVLVGLIDSFRAAMPGIAIRVASADPEATRRQHGVDAFLRTSLREFRSALQGSDALVSGGGSLFQDITSRRSIYYYLGTLMLARLCRRPVMICGQGIGPILRPAARRLTAALFNGARVITVRDPASLETLAGLGVRRPQVRLTADPVFAITPSSRQTADAILAAEGIDPGRPRVAFAIREWRPEGQPASAGDAADSAWAEAAAFAHRELGAQALFVPMHPPADEEYARAIAARSGVPAVVLSRSYSPRDLIALIGRMDLVVAMRLHALIFAALQGVPLVGVTYDPKIDGFLRLLHRTPAASAASIERSVLPGAIGAAWSTRQDEALSLRQVADQLREGALENGALLASLVASRVG